MNNKGLVGILISIILIVALIGMMVILSYSSVDHTTIKVKDKERINNGEDSYYLIFTDDEVFKNKDSFLHMKFGSSDIYSKLEVGKTYRVKVNWFRVPFFSMYRNILEIKDAVYTEGEKE